VLTAAEELVHEGRRARPAAAARPALARVVEQDVAAGRDVLVPEPPVQPRRLLGVVAVDEDQVDRVGPSLRGVLAALDVPGHAWPVAPRGAPDHPAARPLRGGPAGPQRGRMVAEGVDEVQFGRRVQDLAQRRRRRALVDADLHDAPGAARQALEQLPLALGVQAARRDEPRSDRDRAQADVVAHPVGHGAAQHLRERRR
jgi:hypothetical protein